VIPKQVRSIDFELITVVANLTGDSSSRNEIVLAAIQVLFLISMRLRWDFFQ
jgi:hypothetical protein